MAREEDTDEIRCMVCGAEPQVTTEATEDVPEGTITNGFMCRDETHFFCSDHGFSSILEADTHRIADALDSIDTRMAEDAGDE